MLREIEVPFFPSSTDCLSWSEDGELAIAAADHVHILVCLDLLRLSKRPLTRNPRYQSTRLQLAQITQMGYQPLKPFDSERTPLQVGNGLFSNLAAASSSQSGKNNRRATSWQHYGHLQVQLGTGGPYLLS